MCKPLFSIVCWIPLQGFCCRLLSITLFVCVMISPASAANEELTFTDEERDWLKNHPTIVLSSGTDYLPYFSIDKRGQAIGILPDFAELIKEVSGLSIETKIGRWHEEQYLINRGERDGIWAGSKALTDKHQFITTAAYTNLPIAVYAHRDADIDISEFADLQPYNMVTMKGDMSSESLLNKSPMYKSLYLSTSQKEAITRIVDGRSDVLLTDIGFYYQIMHKPDLPLKLLYITDFHYDVTMQFSQQSQTLRNIMDKILARVGQARIQQVIAQWLDLPHTFSQSLLGKKEKQWLQSHAKIRLGFIEGLEPFVIESRDGSYAGVMPEVVKYLAARLNKEVELVVDDFDQLQPMIETGKLHGYLALDEELIQRLGLIQGNYIGELYPALFSHLHEHMSRLEFQSLRGKRIAVVKHSLALDFLQQQLQDNDFILVDSPMQGLQQLMERKVDYFYGLSSNNYYIVKRKLQGIKPLYLNTATSNAYYMAIAPQASELNDILTQLLDQSFQDRLLRIIQKWTHIDISQFSSDLSPEEQQWLAQLPPLKLAVSRFLPPFEYLDNQDQMAGINADYIKILSQRLGFTVEVVKSQYRHDAYIRLISGELDMGFLLYPGVRGGDDLRFSRSIFQTPLSLVTLKDKFNISELSQFNAYTLAVVENSQTHRLLLQEYPLQPLLLVDSLSQGMQAILNGKAKGVLANTVFLNYLLRQPAFHNLHIAFTTPHIHHSYIAVRKEFAPLLPLLNKTLQSFSEQEKQLIFEKWVGVREGPAINWREYIPWIAVTAAVILLFMASFIYWNRRLQLALDEAYQQRLFAEQANTAKSTFLANMSHEIRTPLNAVLGFSELLQKDPNQTPQQLESLNIINTAGSHLLALINDILDISKIEAGQQKCIDVDFNLHKLLNDLQAMFYSRCTEKGLSMACSDIRLLPQYIHADEGKLRQILINLLGNAIKFTDRGKIQCNMHVQMMEEQALMIGIDIIDNGRGIAKSEQQKVFSSYEQTESGLHKSEGTGLGLAISRAYARMMGGDITFVSEIANGATFSLTFKALKVDSIKETQAHRIAGFEERVDYLSILIVDDQASNRLLLQRIIEPLGFAIFQAENGLQAQAEFHDKLPDLVLMDQRMPVMDGLKATQAIKATEAGAKTPIVFISAHAFEEEQAQMLEQGGDGFISKPFRHDEVLSIIGRLLHLTPILQTVACSDSPADSSSAADTATTSTEQLNKDKDDEQASAGKVLIVDDNPVNRTLLQRIMSQAGYHCRDSR